MRGEHPCQEPRLAVEQSLVQLVEVVAVLDLDQVAGPADIGDRRQTHQVGVGPLTVEAAVTWLRLTPRADEVAELDLFDGDLLQHRAVPDRNRYGLGLARWPVDPRHGVLTPGHRAHVLGDEPHGYLVFDLWVATQEFVQLDGARSRSHVVRRQENLDTTPARLSLGSDKEIEEAQDDRAAIGPLLRSVHPYAS